MQDDEWRLPTPPPLPPGAPTYRIPLDDYHTFATLEYPGPVNSLYKALDTVGGLNKVADALANPEPSKRIQLDLQPGNPFFHTIPAHVASTNNVVLKVTKRKRKQPLRDVEGKIVQEGIFKVEPVGVEKKTVRFRAMADFQFTPKVSSEDPIIKLADAVRNMDIAGIRNFKMPEAVEEFPESVYMPPPSFSRHSLPQIFDMKAHSASVRTTTESGSVRLINATRHKTRALQTVLFVQRDVPQGPEESFLKELGRTELTEIEQRMRGILEERPVWTRAGMLNQLTPEEYKVMNNNKAIWPIIGYTFGDGPFRDFVIRFGYDPRQDREARFYQHIMLRNKDNVRDKARPGTRGLIQAQSARKKGNDAAPTTSQCVVLPSLYLTIRLSSASLTLSLQRSLSHEFDGQNVYGKVGNFQLCDISDPLLKSLIESPDGVLPTCSPDSNEGWYAYDYLDQIRQIVRRKWQGLLSGLQVSDQDCEDLVEWELSSQSRAGQSRSQRSGGGPTAKVPGGIGSGKKTAKQKKGKGRASRGSESESASTSASGSGMDEDSESGRGSGGGRTRGGSEDEEDEDDNDRRPDSWSSDGGSAAGPSSSGAAIKARKKPNKAPRAPWEAPRNRRNKAKQPELEQETIARLTRQTRRSSRVGGSSTPAPTADNDE
ncbi:hypothetical protein JCM11641_005575 [Rhodosporidiobolus odoratus]